MSSAVVFGGTGLVGNYLIKTLINDEYYTKVKVFTRSEIDITNSKLEIINTNFDNLEEVKDLIISGGFNVYPKEIEDVINQHKSVIESAVFGIKDNDLGEVPIAAVVMINNNTKIKDLSIFVENNLVKYKTPKKYIVLNELPKNVMGKVQKNILKDKYS